jgi:hypothetical protein
MGIKHLQKFTVAFYKSKARTDLAPQRDKAAKLIGGTSLKLKSSGTQGQGPLSTIRISA